MPTRNRRAFIPQAIRYFLSQDWEQKELIIIDDGEDRVSDLIPDDHRIRYYGLNCRRSLGQKRNIACSRADGEVIFHIDDDDVSLPDRILNQTRRLMMTGAHVTGYHTILFADDTLQRAWRYIGGSTYAVGTSLCYHRSYWMNHAFPDVNVGEDNNMVENARRARVLDSADGERMLVARLHAGNTSASYASIKKKQWTGARGEVWQEVPYEDLASIGYPVKAASVAA